MRRQLGLRAAVVVRDAAGTEVWSVSDLSMARARAFALDLSSSLGLYADPALGRASLGRAGAYRQTIRFVQEMHQVRIEVASRPWQQFLPLVTAVVSTGPLLDLTRYDLWLAELGIGLWLLVVGLIAQAPTPRHRVLEIDDHELRLWEGLVRRTGLRIAGADLAQTRIVDDVFAEPQLVIRTHSGFSTVIEGRTLEELEWISAWIEHARGHALNALPEPVPVPDELSELVARAASREPTR